MFLLISDYPTINDAWAAYPGVIDIVKVCGGWRVFATADELDTWTNQN